MWVERQGDFGNPTYTVVAYVDGHVVIGQQPAPATVSGNAHGAQDDPAAVDKTRPWYGRLYSDFSPEFPISLSWPNAKTKTPPPSSGGGVLKSLLIRLQPDCHSAKQQNVSEQ